MDEHPNAAVIRKMNDAMSGGDIESAASSIADDVVWHEIGAEEPIRGKAQLAARNADFGDATSSTTSTTSLPTTITPSPWVRRRSTAATSR